MRTRSRNTSSVLAFDEFFKTAEPLLRRALVGGFGPDVGREATSETLTYGWKNWDRVAGLDNPTGYLYRVGERWALRYLDQTPRYLDRPGRSSDNDDRSMGGRSMAEYSLAESSAAGSNLDGGGAGVPSNIEPDLAAALETLSLRQRQVVVLVASFGLSHSEAADLLGISRSSIQNHVERGMKKLRTSLGVHE